LDEAVLRSGVVERAPASSTRVQYRGWAMRRPEALARGGYGHALNEAGGREKIMITVLCGGAGGAKLTLGLARVLLPEPLTVIVNTGDDLLWHGLYVAPDVDTVIYTLADSADTTQGWGIREDSTVTLDALTRFGFAKWFRVGDRDLATHLARTVWMNAGVRYTDAVARLTKGWDVTARVLPMCEAPVRTMVRTPAGDLEFQVYFVNRQTSVQVSAVKYVGAERAEPTPEVQAALAQAEAIIVAPSNPLLGIGPMLALPGFRDQLRASPIPIVAVSPIIAGRALNGPAARLLADMGMESSALSVAQLYADFLDGFILDRADAGLEPAVRRLGLDVLVANTVMHSLEDREQLAQAVLAFARQMPKRVP
jgi:LPPG:FO 2-phospho-L-lactate transferase